MELDGHELDRLPALDDGEVFLRAPEERDAAAITRACQDPEIQRRTTVPVPYTDADARWFVAMADERLREGTAVHAVVVDAGGDLLGLTGVRIDPGELTGDVGYWVAPDARGRGVATRATRLLIRFTFAAYGLGRMQLVCATDNAPSNRVAHALGFRHEGVLRAALIDGPSGSATAPRGDANVYGLLPGELT